MFVCFFFSFPLRDLFPITPSTLRHLVTMLSGVNRLSSFLFFLIIFFFCLAVAIRNRRLVLKAFKRFLPSFTEFRSLGKDVSCVYRVLRGCVGLYRFFCFFTGLSRVLRRAQTSFGVHQTAGRHLVQLRTDLFTYDPHLVSSFFSLLLPPSVFFYFSPVFHCFFFRVAFFFVFSVALPFSLPSSPLHFLSNPSTFIPFPPHSILTFRFFFHFFLTNSGCFLSAVRCSVFLFFVLTR